jgi:C-terminal processing protease CtpA/Prc
VILNYPEQTIYLKPNNKFSENFDYSYTGLGIYLIDNVIQVVDIIKHSPGDKAGFKNGDILIGIDNDFSNNIQSYKTALQNAGTRLKVFIIRNHQPMSLKLKVQNILRG